jgi:hypothetical protein
VDRYGRKLPREEGKRLVKKFYRIEDEETESENEEESSSESSKEEEYDPARGIGVVSSSEDEESEDEEFDEEDAESAIIEEDIPKGNATSRLAAVNLDWDNIRAVDILAVLQSFIPVTSDQGIKKVSIYPSEFGKERMQKEALEGPALFESKTYPTEESNSNRDVDTTSLRKYQLERLRYYYAVIECMSVSIANVLYKSLDGSELGATANLLDLRFIPEGMTFDDKPKDEAISLPDDYEPAEFVTDALQHSKPKLTWEAEDPARKRIVSEAFKGDGESGNWGALLPSSDEEEEDEDTREKYRQLLLGDSLPAPKAGSKADIQIALNEEDDEALGEHLNEQEETTLEKYKRKESERKRRKYEAKQARKQAANPVKSTTDLGFDDPFFTSESTNSQKRKEKESKRLAKEQAEVEAAQQAEELELLMHNEASENHFNINHILKAQKIGKYKKKGKRDAEKEKDLQEGFEMNINDPRFVAVYSGGEFAIDPNSAAFKKGMKGMEAVLEESRRQKREAEGSMSNERKKKRR